MNKSVAIGMFVAGCLSWYYPGFGGLFFESVQMTAGEGRIIATLQLVGAAIVWFMPQSRDN